VAAVPARGRIIAAVVLVAVTVTLPFRVRSEVRAADLEHFGFGVSEWRMSSDGERYRAVRGSATLFVPSQADLMFRVKTLSPAVAWLDLRLGGRAADRVLLSPGIWNTIRIPARTQRIASRFSPLDVTIRDERGDLVDAWITKVDARTPGS
jgi:hypothetical protein